MRGPGGLRLAAVVLIALVIAAGCNSRGVTERGTAVPLSSLDCAWPMFGRSPARTFALPDNCKTDLAPATVGRLTKRWFNRTRDVVTATPAVVDDTIYVGDWSGRFVALSTVDGSVRWSFDAPGQKNVYSGQIVASAVVADVDNERRVFFASGKTLYAMDAARGTLRWQHPLNPAGDENDTTEIQSSPVVANGLVIFGYDGHDDPHTRAGIVALDAATGSVAWSFDPDGTRPPTGCGGVWSSPAVDVERGLVISGSANCVTSPAGWNRYSEAIFALDLKTGAPKWSFQPRGPSNNDFDFAGAPNLFEVDGRALVGLGGKDGTYYALDRATGKLAWKVNAAPPKSTRNFSSGGFIGATAVADGLVVGGTAVGGPCPCLHGIDATTGTIAWTQDEAAPTFAASAIVNGVAFAGSTTDFTLRAVDLHSGKVLWSQELVGGVAGGPVVAGSTVIAVAGIREPGVAAAGTESGVYSFALAAGTAPTSAAASEPTLPPTSVAPPDTALDPAAPGAPRCIARPCELEFTLKPPPAGTAPALTVHLVAAPFRIDVRGAGLGPPAAWLRTGSPAQRSGAVTYGVFASDDGLKGSLLCVLDAAFDCVNTTLPTNPRPNYNRLTVLAIADTPVLPSASEGFDRLVTTASLEQPITLR